MSLCRSLQALYISVVNSDLGSLVACSFRSERNDGGGSLLERQNMS